MKNKHTAIDLFAGAGGLGEGFSNKGFNIITSIDSDRHACETLRTREIFRLFNDDKELLKYYRLYTRQIIDRTDLYRFFPELQSHLDDRIRHVELNRNSINFDIKHIRRLLKNMGKNSPDVVIGGPPCQAYSLIGRSRDPKKMKYDKRHYLYQNYLRIIETLRPKMFVYENVPGLITAVNDNGSVVHQFNDDFKRLRSPFTIIPHYTRKRVLFPLSDVHLKDYIIDTSLYGVPQIRKRVFLIGVRTDLYAGNQEHFNQFWQFLEDKQTKKTVTVNQAISDLPKLTPDEGNDKFFSSKYRKSGPSVYSRKMRTGNVGVLNHYARAHMTSDLDRYSYLIKRSIDEGRHITLKDLESDRSDLLPNHKNKSIFQDRFKVQLPDKPASTITAHISKDGHYYIHPDQSQCRSLTVREAARIQSFPDNYYFEGPRTEQFRQVGNAVPPLIAYKIAEVIAELLDGYN